MLALPAAWIVAIVLRDWQGPPVNVVQGIISLVVGTLGGSSPTLTEAWGWNVLSLNAALRSYRSLCNLWVESIFRNRVGRDMGVVSYRRLVLGALLDLLHVHRSAWAPSMPKIRFSGPECTSVARADSEQAVAADHPRRTGSRVSRQICRRSQRFSSAAKDGASGSVGG